MAVSASLIEVALRPDRAWLLATLAVTLVVALALLWRRTHPLAAVAVSFGTLIVFDVVRIVVTVDASGLLSVAAALVLPYAHLATLMRELNARNRVEIAIWAHETGRIDT